MTKYSVILITFLALIFCQQTYAQLPGQIELDCPVGSSATQFGTTFNSSTHKYRRLICVDANGNFFFNAGLGTIPLGANNSWTGNETHSGIETFGNLNGCFTVDGTLYTTIQAAINALPVSGGSVCIPPGTYSISSAISIGAMAVNLKGSGIGVTILLAATGLAGPLLTFNTGATGIFGGSISDLTIDMTAVAAQNGLVLTGSTGGGLNRFSVERVRIINGTIGASISFCSQCTIRSLWLDSQQGTGLLTQADANSDLSLDSVYITNTAASGIGWDYERTTSTDVGGFFAHKIDVFSTNNITPLKMASSQQNTNVSGWISESSFVGANQSSLSNISVLRMNTVAFQTNGANTNGLTITGSGGGLMTTQIQCASCTFQGNGTGSDLVIPTNIGLTNLVITGSNFLGTGTNINLSPGSFNQQGNIILGGGNKFLGTSTNSVQVLLAGEAPALSAAPTIVANLPAIGNANRGQQVVVTDSTAITSEGQTCAGASTNTAIAISIGSAWKCF